MVRDKKTLERKDGFPCVPDPMPTDQQELLDLMDDASSIAATAQGATAPSFDHGMRVFNQLNAHYQIHVVRKLAKAHHGLKVATWWLAGVTVVLCFVEFFKFFRGH